jgi:hypothetical protein
MLRSTVSHRMIESTFTSNWDIVRIKADLLCHGVRGTKAAMAIYGRQNPCGDQKTGNVGLHVSLEGGSHVLITLSHAFDQESPYSIEYDNGRLVLLKEKTRICQLKEVVMLDWYSKKTTSMTAMAAFFLHEGRTFLHQAYSGCDYHAIDLQCRFCGTGRDWSIGTPQEIGETVLEAVKENCDYHVCLGGGTRLPLTRNTSYFSDCLTEIRQRNVDVPVWIETVPPETDEDILRLVRLGATSFGFNIEIWDDALRKEICPGKSQTSKGRYLEAMKTASNILGPNRVGSCLLIGLEPLKSSIMGATQMAAEGIQPCILPFKPWDKSLYGNRRPCDPDDLIKASSAAVQAMIENGVAAEMNEGCLRCEGCTIDHDIYSIMQGEGGN